VLLPYLRPLHPLLAHPFREFRHITDIGNMIFRSFAEITLKTSL
jgi:hypothetical protein